MVVTLKSSSTKQSNNNGRDMKKILVSIFSMIFIIVILSCSEETDPQFRIHNERSTKANVQVKTSGGNTINFNDVLFGQTTEYQLSSEGDIVVTAVIQNENVSPTITFYATKEHRYTIVVQLGNVPALRVVQE